MGFKSQERKYLAKNKTGENTHDLIGDALRFDEVVVSAGTMKKAFISASSSSKYLITELFNISYSPMLWKLLKMLMVYKNKLTVEYAAPTIFTSMEWKVYSQILVNNGMPIMSSLSTVYGLNGYPDFTIKQKEID